MYPFLYSLVTVALHVHSVGRLMEISIAQPVFTKLILLSLCVFHASVFVSS